MSIDNNLYFFAIVFAKKYPKNYFLDFHLTLSPISGAAVCEEISNTPALLLGALLKDFLRSLPEPLLFGNAQEWLNAATSGRLDLLRRLLSNLPRENHMLLRHVVCVLYNIAKKSRFNLMSAANLGIYNTNP